MFKSILYIAGAVVTGVDNTISVKNQIKRKSIETIVAIKNGDAKRVFQENDVLKPVKDMVSDTKSNIKQNIKSIEQEMYENRSVPKTVDAEFTNK